MQTHVFDGADYNHKRDSVRLSSQLERIFNLMKDGRFRSLKDISQIVGAGEASVSANLRNSRKERFGGHTLNRKSLGNGFNLYQIVENTDKQRKLC